MKYVLIILVAFLLGCNGTQEIKEIQETDNFKAGIIVNDSIIYMGRIEAFDPENDLPLKYSIIQQRYKGMFKVNSRGIIYTTKPYFSILRNIDRYKIVVKVEDNKGNATEKTIKINAIKTENI